MQRVTFKTTKQLVVALFSLSKVQFSLVFFLFFISICQKSQAQHSVCQIYPEQTPAFITYV